MSILRLRKILRALWYAPRLIPYYDMMTPNGLLTFVGPLVVEMDRDLYKVRDETRVDTTADTVNEFAGHMLPEVVDFLLYKLEMKIERTPPDKEVDPDDTMYDALEKMENGLVLMIEALHPPTESDMSQQRFEADVLKAVERIQEARRRISERDSPLSPVVGGRFNDISGFRKVLNGE